MSAAHDQAVAAQTIVDLLAALRAVENLYRQPHREQWPDPAQFEEAKRVAAQVRAAIAKAEGVS